MRGFSIVEMVVIIAVVAILAATAMPRFFDLSIFQDRAFYDEAIASVRYAQKLAIATRCPVRVTINPNGLTLFRPANVGDCESGQINTPVIDPANPGGNFTRTPPSSVAITSSVSFDFTAAGSTATNVSVNIGNHSFQVHAATGFVQDLSN